MSERERVILNATTDAMANIGPDDTRSNMEKRADAIQAVVKALKCPPLEATALVDKAVAEAVFG